MCEESLCTNINTDNVLDMLVLSDLHGASSVRALALKFIVENGKEIVAQNGWRDKLKVFSNIINLIKNKLILIFIRCTLRSWQICLKQ